MVRGGRLVLALSAAAVAGCEAPTTPLVELEAFLSIESLWHPASAGTKLSDAPVTVRLSPDEVGKNGCPTIDPETTATLDGIPMALMGTGGYVQRGDSRECTAATFVLAEAPSSAVSTLIISDGTATWTAEIEGLALSDVTMTGSPMTGGHVQVAWPAVPSCDGGVCWSASVSFFDSTEALVRYWSEGCSTFPCIVEGLKWTGNGYDLELRWESGFAVLGKEQPPGTTTGTLKVHAHQVYAVAPIVRCDGPLACAATRSSNSVYPATLF